MFEFSFLTPRNLAIWLVAWTLIGVALMGEDKDQASMRDGSNHLERITERTLHEVALIGGFLGIIIGAKLFRHKVSKTSFWPLVILAIPVWILVICYAIFSRTLTIFLWPR